MVCSPARSAANAVNSALNAAEAKERARRETLEGLTGSGMALPGEDAGMISRRREALFQELNPKSELARMLVGRVAFLGLRLERCQRYDVAQYSQRVRFAGDAHREARCVQVDLYAKELDNDPRYACRCLQSMPEGIDWLIFHIRMLRDDLIIEDRDVWRSNHGWQLMTLFGIKANSQPRISRISVLSEALCWFFANLEPGECEGLTDPEKVQWARRELLAIVDNEIERLQQVRANLDHEMLREDREEAGDRTLFDPSPESILARKYEAATERSLFRTLRELKELDGWVEPPLVEEILEPEVPTEPEVAPEPASRSRGQLGSFFQKTLAPVEIETETPSFPVPGDLKTSARDANGRFVGLPVDFPPDIERS